MKKFYISIIALSALVFGCQKPELADPNENGGQPMKEVTLSAGMGTSDTKAALDSETGQFSWQEGDVISVLATDGKFYDFTLSEGNGEQTAEFAGSIPETAAVTTVATYPALVADATENTSLTENTLMYSLPAEWTWKKEVTNVPMVAAFEEGADHIAFKQVGGVMRFPVKNMPYKGTFVLTMSSRITGEFPVDITALGETNMVTEAVAEGETSTLTIHYNAEVDGDLVEFNVPVPTGTYTNFDIEIKDNNGTSLFTKHYEKENVVERATLLIMSEVELPARGMAAPTVWPYFVDARVLVPTEEGVTQYAVYLDGATEPQIIDATEWNAVLSSIVIGGDFAHKSTHTVALAKVKDGKVLATFGEIHPAVAEKYGLDCKAYVAEIKLGELYSFEQKPVIFAPLPKFPAIQRDFAMLCDASLPVATLEAAIRQGAGKLLEKVELFDVYMGEQIEKGKKSVAYRVTLRSKEATLTDEDSAKISKKIINRLESVGAILRG